MQRLIPYWSLIVSEKIVPLNIIHKTVNTTLNKQKQISICSGCSTQLFHPFSSLRIYNRMKHASQSKLFPQSEVSLRWFIHFFPLSLLFSGIRVRSASIWAASATSGPILKLPDDRSRSEDITFSVSHRTGWLRRQHLLWDWFHHIRDASYV